MGQRARDDAQGFSGGPRRPKESELCKSLGHQAKSVGELEPFPWHLELADVPAGHYWIPSQYCRDDGDPERHIEGLLHRFLESKRYPKVTKLRYDTQDKPFQLLYHKVPSFDRGEGTISVRSHARDVATTSAWAKRLDVPYAGQSLGPFTGVVLDALLRRRRRRYLSDAEKEQLRVAQRNTCALCGDALDRDAIFDHIAPLHQMTQEQSPDSFQAICGQCSADKTKAEARPCLGLLQSHFCKELWSSYILSPKPPCMAFKEDDALEHPCTGPAGSLPVREHLAVDIVRSRYAALYHIPDPGLPVFTALDDIRPVSVDEGLPDLVYIDKEASPAGIGELTELLPFHGRGWYPRPAVQSCCTLARSHGPS
jgi:hypothetical protein